MNILVVDDEREQVESLQRGLRTKGNKVLGALSGREALDRLKNDDIKIDLVITDYRMSDIDGIALLKSIRANYGTLPVILMTAFGEKETIIDALRGRCDGFIEKPFVLDQLLREIERATTNVIQNKKSDHLRKIVPMLAHQINNPLSVIAASTGLAMNHFDDTERIANYIKNIAKASRKITHINKELMGLGVRSEKKFHPLNIKILLEECLNMFEDLFLLKKITLVKDLDEADLLCSGDEFSLEQVFKNLILNAIESMEGETQKQLKIKATVMPKTSSLSLDIEDTGCGISQTSADDIYKPYFTTKEKGTGLGLAVVQSIVREHGGTLGMKSRVGKGTTFTIELPLITT